MIEVLKQCEKWFLEYAKNHKEKGNIEKYETNLRKATYCSEQIKKYNASFYINEKVEMLFNGRWEDAVITATYSYRGKAPILGEYSTRNQSEVRRKE